VVNSVLSVKLLQAPVPPFFDNSFSKTLILGRAVRQNARKKNPERATSFHVTNSLSLPLGYHSSTPSLHSLVESGGKIREVAVQSQHMCQLCDSVVTLYCWRHFFLPNTDLRLVDHVLWVATSLHTLLHIGLQEHGFYIMTSDVGTPPLHDMSCTA
jgi:hypothetical protein